MYVIIVGGGKLGLRVAIDLITDDKDVTLIEKGPFTKIGNAYEHYDNSNVGVELLQKSCVGGTTLVTAGNAVRTCQKHLAKMGIDLEDDFNGIEKEMGVSTLPDTHFGNGTKLIMESAEKMGFKNEDAAKTRKYKCMQSLMNIMKGNAVLTNDSYGRK